MFEIKKYSSDLAERGITVEDALEERFWVDGKGTVIYLTDMTTEHISNCLEFLRRGYFFNGRTKIHVPGFYKEKESLFVEMFRTELIRRAPGKK